MIKGSCLCGQVAFVVDGSISGMERERDWFKIKKGQ